MLKQKFTFSSNGYFSIDDLLMPPNLIPFDIRRGFGGGCHYKVQVVDQPDQLGDQKLNPIDDLSQFRYFPWQKYLAYIPREYLGAEVPYSSPAGVPNRDRTLP